MNLRTRRRFRVTLLALCGLLLAQWTLATHACPAIRQAGKAIVQSQIETALAAQAGTDCHGSVAHADSSAAPAESATCIKHCADEGSATNGAGVTFAVSVAPPLVLRNQLPADTGPLHWQQAPARGDSTAPPLSILYCVFLS
jgi:hypothetical protein